MVAFRVHKADVKIAKVCARERDWQKHPALARRGVATGAPPGYSTVLGEWIWEAAKRARKNLGDRKRRAQAGFAT